MGIGFVLLFWALILGVLAAGGAVLFAALSWWNQRRALGRVSVFKVAGAAAIPFVLLAYFGAAFMVYALWCQAIRDVDPGIGDGWQVPIGNHHYFCMIDVPDDGYLMKDGCSGSPIVDEITEIAAAGDLLVGNSKSSGPFVLDTKTGALQKTASIDAALASITPRPTLMDAQQFYNDRRWGVADAVAGVVIGIPAVAFLIAGYLWFIRARR